MLPLPISDYSLAVHQNKAAVEEFHPEYFYHFISIRHFTSHSTTTYQADTDVSEITVGSIPEHTFNKPHNPLSIFFFLRIFEIELTKWLL